MHLQAPFVRVAAMLGLCAIAALARSTNSDATEPKGAATKVAPLASAHAHNDYAHRRPLLDALDNGFSSVEADIFLVDGELLVAHTIFEVRTSRTLKSLYLDPLAERVKATGGVYGKGSEFTLMVDSKTKAEPTYELLSKQLADYAEMLSVVRDGKLERRAVNIVLSGNRPHDVVAAQRERYVGIDGRTGDLDSDTPAHLMPWISDSWKNHFQWDGTGVMPAAEHAKLTDYVKRAHAKGRRIRFWAAPDRIETWRALSAAKVDLINTDDLVGLAKFLHEAQK
jgi:hypothetical protein